jgi:hypothetical protein
MSFHPLPMSVRIGSFYVRVSQPIKIIITPFFSIVITSIFCLEIILLPFRWLCHEICNIYSDMDESEWAINN